MASESTDPALSPDVISFVIAGKIRKLGDPIHITWKKKKMVETFGAEFASAKAEGVFMGREPESGHKYRYQL